MEQNNAQADGLTSRLTQELEPSENNVMCHWIGDTELSHYLMSHINDDENLTQEQSLACSTGGLIIYQLRKEVVELREKLFCLENNCVMCGCGDYYVKGTLAAEMIEKCGQCENCL